MCDLWIKKYKPDNIGEIIGNKSNIQKINSLINNFKDAEYSNFVISGYHGVGKNTIIKLILEKNNYTIKYLCYKDEKAEDLFNDLINYCNGQHIDNLFKKQITKFALVINDIEKISLKNEKIRIKELVQLNNTKKLLPIIFISNIQHNKLLIDILTYSYNITINKPTKKNLLIFLNRIIENENMNVDDEVKEQIIDFAQYDIRRLISILYDIKNSFNDIEVIDINCLQLYFNTSNKKLKDTNLFEATKTLINEYTNISNCLSFYKVDKVLIPLTIHENYSKGLFDKCKNNGDLLESFKNISDSISKGDVIETNIYTDQNWFLHDIHGFYTCCKTSFHLNKNNSNPSKKIDYEMKFSSDLNQTSLKNINRKQITNLQKILPNKRIIDIINLNKIIYNLVLDEKFDIIYNIIKSYNSNVKIIENIIKIDKTINKITLSQKNKKLYNSYIKNDI